MSDQTDWKMHFKIAAFDVIGRLCLWQWPSQETNFTSPNPINMVRATSIQQVLCIRPKTFDEWRNKIRTCMARSIDYLLNIWAFVAMKICLVAYLKISQSMQNILPINK